MSLSRFKANYRLEKLVVGTRFFIRALLKKTANSLIVQLPNEHQVSGKSNSCICGKNLNRMHE